MESRGGEEPHHFTAALRMNLQRLVGELLNHFKSLAAGGALVFVQRHTTQLYAKGRGSLLLGSRAPWTRLGGRRSGEGGRGDTFHVFLIDLQGKHVGVFHKSVHYAFETDLISGIERHTLQRIFELQERITSRAFHVQQHLIGRGLGNNLALEHLEGATLLRGDLRTL